MGKKKLKLKYKKIGIILGIILCIGIIGTITGITLYNQNINHHFYSYAKSNKKASLYNKNKKVVGTISKEYSLELTKSSLKEYFKIKDTDYYIHYQDIKKGKETDKISLEDHQLTLNKEITTTKKTTLSKENKKVLTINKKATFQVAYEDDQNYYVFFQNNLLEIPKEESIKENNLDSKEEAADHVSVLYYETIADSCYDANCTTTSDFKNHIASILENKYYTITKEEFKNYINGYIRLKPNALFITTSTSLESLNPIIEEYKISIQNIDNEEDLLYFSTNQTNTVEATKEAVNRYQIRNNTPNEEIIKMALGEKKEIVQDNQGIAVLNYHFFYTSSLGEGCNESICLDTAKLREHLDYLKANHYKTLTMSEFRRWMYGEIELPTNSVLLTVDDGAMGTGKHNGNKLIPILEEYKMHATLFLITGWWDIENYRSPYLDIQSHTYDMHQYGSCGRGQINCATYEEAKTDLEKSLAIIGNNDSFCFPFYMYNNTSLQAVKDVGFKLAFVGGNRKANRQMNKYLITRYPIQSDISLQTFINIVS